MSRLHIVNARWTPTVNMLVIVCAACGHRFEHRADRWNACCPQCRESGHLGDLREDYRLRASAHHALTGNRFE